MGGPCTMEYLRNCCCNGKNLLTVLTVVGILCGIMIGTVMRNSREEAWTARECLYVKFLGEIFLRMLNAVVIPLIVSSLVSAVGCLNVKISGRIGLRAAIFFAATTISAVVLGIILVIAIHPGHLNKEDAGERIDQRNTTTIDKLNTTTIDKLNTTTIDTLMDLFRNMFPSNLVHATLYQSHTVLEIPENLTRFENGTYLPRLVDWKMSLESVEGMNILGLVTFATVLGITLGKMGPKGQPLLDLFVCLSETMIIITQGIVWLTPIGVCFLVASQLIEASDISDLLEKLGLYFVTVLTGLMIHGFIVLPFLYGVVTRSLPFRFIMNMTQALATAFGTASSAATLPVTMACLEEKNGVDPRVSRFVLPIGATINMDGTALWEAVAAIFISQVNNIPLSMGTILAISITATAASIGAAGVPEGGLVTMVMVLNTIGLSPKYMAYIVPVDWLLDRFRTTINVLSDAIGAGLVDYMSHEELRVKTKDEFHHQIPRILKEEMN